MSAIAHTVNCEIIRLIFATRSVYFLRVLLFAFCFIAAFYVREVQSYEHGYRQLYTVVDKHSRFQAVYVSRETLKTPKNLGESFT